MPIPLRGPVATDPVTGRCLLERALVVVRFLPILTIGDQSSGAVARFQDKVRSRYPLFHEEIEQMMQVQAGEDGEITTQRINHFVYRFLDIENNWRVSLTTKSLALEAKTSGYESWADFSDRITDLIRLVYDLFAPSHSESIGVRFLNTGQADCPDDPRKVCAKELVSITGDSNLVAADMAWLFRVDEGELRLRSGLVRPHGTYDPTFFESRPDPTWYLDIDVYRSGMAAFDCDSLSQSIKDQVKRVYAVYRWAMPPESSLDSAL